MQLNAYRWVLQRDYGKRVLGMFLLALHPGRSSYLHVEVPVLEAELADMVASWIVSPRI